MSPDSCFHCALPNPPNAEFQVEIDGELRAVCCPGCQAVAELIRDSGMTSYYAMRDAPTPGVGRPADDQAEWQVFDTEDMLGSFASLDGDVATATVYVGKMYCAACSWLIETTLARTRGVSSASVNPITHRLNVTWDSREIGLGGILATLANLGYEPQPLGPDSAVRPEVAEQRMALKRLLVASLGMMQVMMFAIGLYAGDFQGMDPDMQTFLRVISLIVTTPVVFYSARPFFASAWRGVVARSPGMDLPVSIAIGSAYAASVYATLHNGEAVWFDSVVMFVFFLTLGRFLEMRARHRSIDRTTALSSMLPNTVTRIEDGSTRVVPATQVVAGDLLRIRPGDSIPADGVIISGSTSVDEALLTGEAKPQSRAVGDDVVAGSINLDGGIEVEVRATGDDTALGAIARLSERARYARPAFVQLADRIASYIVVAILVVAVAVAVYWYLNDPERAFVITLSVLVVTCPCALALATPAAFAAAGTRLAELHLLVTNGNAIEVLSRATSMLFDKTGTLTRGAPVITSVRVVDDAYSEDQCRQFAAALEAISSHPIAQAFQRPGDGVTATDLQVVVGEGVEGTINGQPWRLGRPEFVLGGSQRDTAAESGETLVYLGVDDQAVAEFTLDDDLRPGVAATLDKLRSLGLTLRLASGDNEAAVRNTASQIEITDYKSGCSPDEKLELITAQQQAGEVVVMVGDGINDAPVLAGADASIAPGQGAMLAQTNADIVMLGESLEPIATGVRTARQTMRIVRQNLAWAIVYNAAALPLAALGYVPPWAAAIGMSASSLIVVLNALRLSRYDRR